MHLLSGTDSQLVTLLNWKEFKGNLQLYVAQDFLVAYVAINMKIFHIKFVNTPFKEEAS
jgi:hypothetical protein